MKMTVTFNDFAKAFDRLDRSTQFSPEGLKALFRYIEDYEECTGEEMELDVIALCCDYTEYASVKYAATDYGIEFEDRDTALEELRDRTVVIPVKNGIILQNF